MGDWLADLEEFPAPIVAAACQVWRQGQTKRPTIADIRALCVEERNSQAWRQNRQHQLPPPDLSQALGADREANQRIYREAAEARDQWAKEHGCIDFGHALQIGLARVSNRNVP